MCIKLNAFVAFIIKSISEKMLRMSEYSKEWPPHRDLLSEISGSQVGDCEDGCLMGFALYSLTGVDRHYRNAYCFRH